MTGSGAPRARVATLKEILDRWIPSLVAVFLFYTPFLAGLGAERNRYFLFWGRRDTLAILLSIVLLSGVAALLGAAIDRLGNGALSALRDLTFLTFLGLGVLANLLPLLHVEALLDFAREHRRRAGILLDLASGVLAVAWVLGVWLRRERMMRVARGATFILAPLVVLLLGPALSWRSWDYPRDPIPASAGEGEPGVPVYFLVFDEWSYQRLTEGDDVRPEFANVRAFKDHALFFTTARAPAESTHVSLPRILFQSRKDEALPYVFIDRKDPEDASEAQPEHITGDPAPAGAPESLMALARRNRYTTYLVGFYLPYPHIMGNDVDVDRAYSNYPKGDGLVERMVITTLGAPQYWFMPGISGLWKGVWSRVFSRHWVRLNRRVRDDLFAIADTAPARSLVFIHYPAPHAPFVFEPDGSFRGPFPVNSSATADVDTDIMAGTPEDYHRQMLYVDRVIGETVLRLKRAGDYDRALIILTADHSWRVDPAIAPGDEHRARRHVPLLVKLPGQATPRTLDTDVALDELRPLIERTMHGEVGESSVVAAESLFLPIVAKSPTVSRIPAPAAVSR